MVTAAGKGSLLNYQPRPFPPNPNTNSTQKFVTNELAKASQSINLLNAAVAAAMSAQAGEGSPLASSSVNFNSGDAAVEVWVDPSGSDSGVGSEDDPFATFQYAANYLGQYDYEALYIGTIQANDGVYVQGGINLPALYNTGIGIFGAQLGGFLTGNIASRSSCVIDGFHAGLNTFAFNDYGSTWTIQGFTVTSTGYGFQILAPSSVVIDSIIFDGVPIVAYTQVPGVLLQLGYDAYVIDHLVSGSYDPNAIQFWQLSYYGSIIDNGVTTTFDSSLATAGYALIVQANYFCFVFWPAGTVVGASYLAGANAFDIGQYTVLDERAFPDRSQFIGQPASGVSGATLDPTCFIFEDPVYNIYTPSSGDTVTPTPGEKSTILNPSGSLATLTVNPPAFQCDQETWRVATAQAISALTITTTDGSTVVGPPSSLVAGASFQLTFDGPTTTWYIS